MNCTMSTRRPWPTARKAVPRAQVVLPLPGPVYTINSPLSSAIVFSRVASGQVHALDQLPGDALHPVDGGFRRCLPRRGVAVFEHDPQPGPVDLVLPGDDGPGQ